MSVEAMKLALEEMKIGNYNSAAERLEAALAQPQQEPVECANGCRGFFKHHPPARKPLPDGIPSPDELEALSDGNSGMIFNEGFPTKLDRLACWLREYAAIEAAHGIKEQP